MLMSIRETADWLAISESQVYRLVSLGHIPSYRIGTRCIRIKEADLELYLERQRTESFRLPEATKRHF